MLTIAEKMIQNVGEEAWLIVTPEIGLSEVVYQTLRRNRKAGKLRAISNMSW
jgi:hypothetical protein